MHTTDRTRAVGCFSIPATSNALNRVQITDIMVGDGDAAETGKGVTLKWVLRRSNGYYVSSSTEGAGEPFIYRVSTTVVSARRKVSKGFVARLLLQ